MLPSLFVAVSLALAPAPEVVEKTSEVATADNKRELQFRFGDNSNGYECASWCTDRSQCSTPQCFGCMPLCDNMIKVCQPWCTQWTCPRGNTKFVQQFRDDCSACYVCRNAGPGTVDPSSMCAMTAMPATGYSPAQCDAFIYRHGCSATYATACPGSTPPSGLSASTPLSTSCSAACSGR